MISGRVVIPARRASERLTNKNLAILGGKPLIDWTLEFATELAISWPILVSTDSEIIAERADSFLGVHVSWRPQELAGANASIEALLRYLGLQASEENGESGWTLLLQPTSPFRRRETFMNLIQLVETQRDAECVMTVTPNVADFWRMLEDGRRLGRVRDGEPRRQQDRNPWFDENGNQYLLRDGALASKMEIAKLTTYGIATSRLEGIDINDAADLAIAESLIPLWDANSAADN